MLKKIFLLSCFLFLILNLSVSEAATIMGPTYPAPGGNDLSISGYPGEFGGRTFGYSQFDDTQYGDLYWGPWEGAPIGLSLNGGSITGSENMTFNSSLSDLSSGKAVWLGSSYWTWASYGSSSWYYDSPIATRFTLQVSSNLIADDGFTLESSGNPLSVDVLTPVTGDFTANLLFEALFPYYGWLPVDYGFDRFQTNNYTYKTFSGGFYYTEPAAVPEPATMLLIGTGLIGLVGARRRFKK